MSRRLHLVMRVVAAVALCAHARAQDEAPPPSPPDAGSSTSPPQATSGVGVDPDTARRFAEARVALARDFFDPTMHARLARLHYEVGAHAMAFWILTQARTNYFSAAEIHAAMVAEFGALTGMRDFVLDKESGVPELDEARAALRRGDTQAARALAESVLARAGTDSEGRRLGLAVALCRQAGASERARSAAEEYLAAHPGDIAVSIELAEILRAAGDLEGARQVVRQALAVHPDEARLHFSFGFLASGSGDPVVSFQAFGRAVELDASQPLYRAWLARAYLVDREDRATALEHYLRAWFADPLVADVVPVRERIVSIFEDLAAEDLAQRIRPEDALAAFDHWNPQVALGAWSLAMSHEDEGVLFMRALDHLAHDDERVRFIAARYLIERAPAPALPLVDEELDGSRVIPRSMARYVLVRRDGEARAALAARGLKSSAAFERAMTLRALAERHEPWATRLLTAHLSSEPIPRLVQLFAKAAESR